ncbi:unnamed protein product [Arctogadus glacialis]
MLSDHLREVIHGGSWCSHEHHPPTPPVCSLSTEARSLTQPLGNPTPDLLKAPQNYGLGGLGFSTGGLNRAVHQPQTSPGTSGLTVVPLVSTQQQQNHHGATERYPPCGACVANESFTAALHTRLWLGL